MRKRGKERGRGIGWEGEEEQELYAQGVKEERIIKGKGKGMGIRRGYGDEEKGGGERGKRIGRGSMKGERKRMGRGDNGKGKKREEIWEKGTGRGDDERKRRG